MKILRFLLCFFLLGGLSFFNGNAQTLTREQAQTLASEFLAQGTRATRSVAPALAFQWDSRHLSPVATIAAEEAAPAFYAFARESGEGFVIISSDANNPRVLGYSLESSLPSVNDIPDGMRDFLTEYSMAPAQTKQSRASYDYNTSMGNIKVNLNTAPWGQHAPFNNYCYVKDGGNGSAITGCVPTAYSILMYYHKWPVAANPVRVYHSGTGENRVLGHEYDWANMLHSYSGTYTDTQAHAVATLMSDMGWAYQVKYSATNTSTEFGYGEGALKLIEVFKYKSNSPEYDSDTYATVRHNVDDATWKGYIKQSLDAKLPIPYSSTTTATGTGRHIYILDGYTDNDYYHFNWGWSGNGNGWFLLSDMTPDNTSNYSNSHKAYFMLSPNRGEPCTITVSANCGTCGTVSAAYGSSNGTSISVDQGSKVTLTATPATGYVFDNWTCGGEEVSTSATCTVTANATAEYVANFVAATSTYQISTSVFGAEGGTAMFQVGENELTTSSNVIPGREVTLIAEPAEGYSFEKWTSGTTTISENATCTVTANGNANYVAYFKHITHTVCVSASDAVFGSIQIDGGDAAASAEKTVNYGTEVTLTAEPKSGYVFKHWTSGGDVVSIDNPLRVDVTDDVNYVAVFIPQSQNTGVSIVATTDGGGTATVNSNNSVNAERNEEITLAATPASGYYFVEWRVGDEVVSTKATFTTSAQTARTYKAVFAALPTGDVKILLGKTKGNASIEKDGVKQSLPAYFAPGTRLKLLAQKTSYDFICWSVGGSLASGGKAFSNEMEVEVVVTEPTTYFATFGTATPVSATASANTGGTAEVTGDQTYAGEVIFKATANTGYNFTNWTNAGGQVVSTEPYYTTLLTSDLALTANFEVSGSVGPSTPDIPTPEVYNISVAVNGTNGTATASSNSVTQGQQVTLTATPNAGYEFVNWTLGGTVVSTEATYTFTPTASGEYVANFAPITYTVQASTANRDLGMIQIGEEAGTGTTTQTATVNHGSTVTMHAIVTNPTLYRFVNWTSGTNVVSTDNPLRFTASANVNYVANFEAIPVTPQYTISVSAANGQGVVTATSGTNSGTRLTVDQGTQVTLTATPNEGYQFVNWTLGGVEVSTNAEYTVIANATEEYVANFALKTYTLTVGTSDKAMGRAFFSTGSGTGTGTGTGTGGLVTEKTVGHGESVTMEAVVTDPSVYRFVNWTVNGVEVSTSTTFTTTATAAAEYVANFEEIPVVTPQYTISVNSSNSDYGTVAVLEFGTSTSQKVDAGTTLTLVATPKANCKFVNWTCGGEVVSADATFYVTVAAAANYVANFEQGVVVEPEVPSTLPEDGKAYIIRNVQKDGTMYMLTNDYYRNGVNPTLLTANGNTAQDKGENYENVFICRVIDKENKKYYAFVNAKNGLYMMYHGIGQTDPFPSDESNIPGFMAYDNGDNKKCDLVVTESDTKSGHYTISGLRNRLDKGDDAWATMTIGHDGVMNANGTIDNPSYDDKYSSYFTFEEVLDYPNKVTLASFEGSQLITNLEGYTIGTFSAPFPTVVPFDPAVEAYYAEQVKGTDYVKLKAIAKTAAIPANQGVILVGKSESATSALMKPATEERAAVFSNNNMFAHTAGATTTTVAGDYVLARGSQGIGFYEANAGGTLAMNKAFLRMGNSNVAAFRLVVDEDVTAIDGVATEKADAPIYDLSGRRVMQTVKGGVYIQNGKKFIVK